MESKSGRFQIVGPKFLSGPAGGRVAGRWGLMTEAVDETLRVSWEIDGETVVDGSWSTAVDFGLEEREPGEIVRLKLRARVQGSDGKFECPEREILIGVTR